jgi:hypothetical protein
MGVWTEQCLTKRFELILMHEARGQCVCLHVSAKYDSVQCLSCVRFGKVMASTVKVQTPTKVLCHAFVCIPPPLSLKIDQRQSP